MCGRSQLEVYLEEAQASLRASKAKGISEKERVMLIKDAQERLPEGIELVDVIEQLYLEVQ